MSEYVFAIDETRMDIMGNMPCRKKEQIVRCSECAKRMPGDRDDRLWCSQHGCWTILDGFCHHGRRDEAAIPLQANVLEVSDEYGAIASMFSDNPCDRFALRELAVALERVDYTSGACSTFQCEEEVCDAAGIDYASMPNASYALRAAAHEIAHRIRIAIGEPSADSAETANRGL